MTCPDCEYHKSRAALWRNKAYELGGSPLPWDADEVVKKAVQAEREAIAQMFDDAPRLIEYAQNGNGGCLICGFTPKYAAAAIRARSNHA